MKEFLIKEEIQNSSKILNESKVSESLLMMNIELACSINCRNRRLANWYVKNNIKNIMGEKIKC